MSGPDQMRIGDAERDALTAALHEHFAQGRLDRDELDERLGAALAAKTVGDLRPILHDLPHLPEQPGVRELLHPSGDMALARSRRHHGQWNPHWGGPWVGPPAYGPPWRRYNRGLGFPRLLPLLALSLIAAAATGLWIVAFVVQIWLVVTVLELAGRWLRHAGGRHRLHGDSGRRHHRHRDGGYIGVPGGPV
jgi:hypothetical protein